jgi:hypothetical protein
MKTTANANRKIEEKMIEFLANNPTAKVSDLKEYGLKIADEGLGVSKATRGAIDAMASRMKFRQMNANEFTHQGRD